MLGVPSREDERDRLARGSSGDDDPQSIADNNAEQTQNYEQRVEKNVEQLLERAVGPEMVDDLTIQVMPRRMEPGRETAGAEAMRDAAQSARDEADLISDPGMRRIYKAARRRETA